MWRTNDGGRRTEREQGGLCKTQGRIWRKNENKCCWPIKDTGHFGDNAENILMNTYSGEEARSGVTTKNSREIWVKEMIRF